jgi:hypothetical protein
MVVTHSSSTQEERQTKYIYINFKKLNVATKKNPYPLHFINEVINTVVGYEAYSFLNGYSKYHQIFITLKDRCNTIFVTNEGTFIWKVMSFEIKNGPPTYHIIVTKTLKNIWTIL